jgi:hypothetical protein
MARLSFFCIKMGMGTGIIQTGENRSPWSEACASATLFVTDLTRTSPGHSLGHCGDRPATMKLARSKLKALTLM